MSLTFNDELYPKQFFCPKCFGNKPYGVNRVSVKTHFYYIPIFENECLEHVVECRVCKKSFNPSVLNRYNQTLFRLAAVARDKLLQGTSFEILKEEMTSTGIKKELADKLLLLAQI